MEFAVKIILSIVFFKAIAVAADKEDEYHKRVESSFDTMVEEYPDFWKDPFVVDRDYSATGVDFTCPHYGPPSEAESVHKLTPYDIKVVAALGDSITAAFFARFNLFDLLAEYRGVSWSIGGDDTLEKVATLPNMIKKYSPDVTGFSVGKGNKDSDNARLNVAVSASVSQDLPEQAEKLIAKMKADPSIDIEKDWKVVTLWIGGNNLCWSCINRDKHTVYNYIGSIREALDILYDESPRTFVNLVLNIDVTKLGLLSDYYSFCNFLNTFECPCRNNQDTKDLASQYQYALYEEVYGTGRYDGKDDFTVVIQPFFLDTEVPLNSDGSPDLDYFALDCFHFSTRAHKEAAIALWNNMLQPVGSKSTSWELDGPMQCPTEDAPYFYTVENSPSSNLVLGKNPAAGKNNDDSSHLVAIATGSSIGVVLILVVVFTVGGVWAYRRKSNRNSSEQQFLLK